MSKTRIDCQPGYLLHSRPYRNTSLIIEVFSHDYGRVGLVVRGARGPRSRWTAVMQPFQRLLLSWQGRGELKTLTAAEPDAPSRWLQGNVLISGLYANELLLRLLQREDPHAQLLMVYEQLLIKLTESQNQSTQAATLEQSLRCFEKQLLQELGYGLMLEQDARSGKPIDQHGRYHYFIDEGPVLCAQLPASGFIIAGSTLLALARNQALNNTARREAKHLMREALQRHLGDRPLHSRRLYRRPA